MNNLIARLIAYVFVAVFCAGGPLLLSVAVDSARQRVELIQSGLRAVGTVVAKRSTASTRAIYAPVFQFTARDRRNYVVSSDVYGLETAFRDGERVRVLYRPGHPESARIDSFAQLWTLPLACAVVGASFSLIPLLVLKNWVRRRAMRRGEAKGIAR